MPRADQQAEIDAISWYHEFDFGHGLTARSQTPDAAWHRRLNSFLRQQLDGIDFQGKTVLDIGCWDGYWSFHAERRGAAAVLAADDFTQNWSDARGISLAKHLLGSSVEVVQDLSIYGLASLGRKFDVILCLGVYYHLWDPFLAFAQIRHCCHRESMLVLEGNVTVGLPPGGIYLSAASAVSKFTPTVKALTEMLAAAYFRPEAPVFMSSMSEDPGPPPTEASPPPEVLGRPTWRRRLHTFLEAARGSREFSAPSAEGSPAPAPLLPHPVDRVFLRCLPHEGPNDVHTYRPPLGLSVYDSRFHESDRPWPQTADR